jgi:hypothetical protein
MTSQYQIVADVILKELQEFDYGVLTQYNHL